MISDLRGGSVQLVDRMKLNLVESGSGEIMIGTEYNPGQILLDPLTTMKRELDFKNLDAGLMQVPSAMLPAVQKIDVNNV